MTKPQKLREEIEVALVRKRMKKGDLATMMHMSRFQMSRRFREPETIKIDELIQMEKILGTNFLAERIK